MGEHHVYYCSNAVYLMDGEYIKVPVDSRVMVDVVYFRKLNPNYSTLRINKLARSSPSNSYIYFHSAEAGEVEKQEP